MSDPFYHTGDSCPCCDSVDVTAAYCACHGFGVLGCVVVYTCLGCGCRWWNHGPGCSGGAGPSVTLET